MEHNKRKRLEAAGWQVGSTADFLGLSYEETVYVELRIRLSDALRAIRIERGLSQEEVAVATGSSQSRVAKMEKSDPSVSFTSRLDALRLWLLALARRCGQSKIL